MYGIEDLIRNIVFQYGPGTYPTALLLDMGLSKLIKEKDYPEDVNTQIEQWVKDLVIETEDSSITIKRVEAGDQGWFQRWDIIEVL